MDADRSLTTLWNWISGIKCTNVRCSFFVFGGQITPKRVTIVGGPFFFLQSIYQNDCLWCVE